LIPCVNKLRKIAAISYYGMSEIHFDKKIVLALTAPTRRWLVFHELGHCELGLPHMAGQVIMQQHAPTFIDTLPYEVMDHELAHILLSMGRPVDVDASKKRWQLSHYVRQRDRLKVLTTLK